MLDNQHCQPATIHGDHRDNDPHGHKGDDLPLTREQEAEKQKERERDKAHIHTHIHSLSDVPRPGVICCGCGLPGVECLRCPGHFDHPDMTLATVMFTDKQSIAQQTILVVHNLSAACIPQKTATKSAALHFDKVFLTNVSDFNVLGDSREGASFAAVA